MATLTRQTYDASPLVQFEWTLDNGEFSMSATIWDSPQRGERNFVRGGQCVDEAAAMVPDDAKAQRMLAVWGCWHLNKLRAGSPAQSAYLRANPIPESEYRYPKSHYIVASDWLAEAGLNPDTSFVRPDYLSANVRTDNGYRYGSAWLHENLPADIIAEIESWSA